jgi:Domain of unknown function (DUF1996)
MRGRRRVSVIVAGACVLAFGLGAANVGAATQPPPPGALPGPNPRFVTKCDFSHQLPDDPIVKFGMPGASHLHEFFGNTTTNAFSTVKTLNKGATTCLDEFDKSGYWVPALSVDGVRVEPKNVSVYYLANDKPLKKIRPIPRGLEVVAGDATATDPQSLKIVSWNCGANEKDIPKTAEPPTCPSPTLTLHVSFPDCWNGTDLDSADHKSHLAYSKDGVCPDGYPVPIPKPRINVHYPTTGGPGVTLASGGQYSGHADFFNDWLPKEQRRLIQACIKNGVECNAKESAGLST